jgi:hypothetical protein
MNDEVMKWLADKLAWEHVTHGCYMNEDGALMIASGELTERSAWDVMCKFRLEIEWDNHYTDIYAGDAICAYWDGEGFSQTVDADPIAAVTAAVEALYEREQKDVSHST